MTPAAGEEGARRFRARPGWFNANSLEPTVLSWGSLRDSKLATSLSRVIWERTVPVVYGVSQWSHRKHVPQLRTVALCGRTGVAFTLGQARRSVSRLAGDLTTGALESLEQNSIAIADDHLEARRHARGLQAVPATVLHSQ